MATPKRSNVGPTAPASTLPAAQPDWTDGRVSSPPPSRPPRLPGSVPRCLENTPGPFIAVFALMTFVLMWIMYLWWSQRRARQRKRRKEEAAEGRLQHKLAPLTMSVCHIANKNEECEAAGSSECAICLEEYEMDDLIVTLLCRHTFHRRCIEQWLFRLAAQVGSHDWDEDQALLRACTCPLCKGPVFACSSSGTSVTGSASHLSTPELTSAPVAQLAHVPTPSLSSVRVAPAPSTPRPDEGVPEGLEV